MYGTWHVYRPGQAWSKPRSEARLVLRVADAVVVNFGAPVIELLEERALALHQPIHGLGPDLLDDDFHVEEALQRLREPVRASVTVGDAIMDQRVMAGVGNIWKHETLFRLGLNPWRSLGELDDAALRAVVETAQDLLRASVGKPNRLNLRKRPQMYVYGRPGQLCFRCRTRLVSATQGLDIRRTTWCPTCQPVVDGQRLVPGVRRLSKDEK